MCRIDVKVCIRILLHVPGPEHYPEMKLCPLPAFDDKVLSGYGYYSTGYYGAGVIGGVNMNGWVGNNTGNNFENVTNDIVTIKSVDDCPLANVVFTVNGSYHRERLKMKLTRVMHPYGRCCLAIVPKIAKQATIQRIFAKKSTNCPQTLIRQFRLFLSDRMSANDFHQNKFAIDGFPIIADSKEIGFIFYNLKIHSQRYVENTNEFKCRNYPSYGDYGKCLSKIYLQQSLEILNCTAPWLTEIEHLWCTDYLDLPQNISKKFADLLGSIQGNINKMKEQCLPPCKTDL